MTSFCIPQGVQDIENARRTSLTYTYTGTWDPRLNPTDAKPGTVFYYLGDPANGILPTVLQKMDNGCTMNWILVGGGATPITASNVIYVDANSTSSAPDGTEANPFKTIQEGIDEIVARGGAGEVQVAPATYPETLNLNDPALLSLSIISSGSGVGTGGAAIDGTTLGAAFNTFWMEGFTLSGTVDMFSLHDGGAVFGNNGSFKMCTFTAKITIKNLIVMNFHRCKVDNDFEIENVFIGVMDGEAGMGPGTLTLNTIPANPKPAVWVNGMGAVYLISGTVCLATTVNLSDDSELQLRNGVRFSNPGGVITIGTTAPNSTARFTAYNSWMWAGTVGGTGTYTENGTHHDPTVSNLSVTTYVKGHKQGVKNIVGNYPVVAQDEVLLVDATGGAAAMSLPTAANMRGQRLTIKKIDVSVNPVNINPFGGETIDGVAAPAVVLVAQWQSVDIISDGVNWFIL
jgi:hypothetical protein